MLLPARLFNFPTSFVITNSNGNLLNACIAGDGQWRFPYNGTVPDKFAKCISTFEDKRFFYHLGVDPVAICRAVWQNSRNRRTVSGGGTLTKQIVKLFKAHANRSLWNKLNESVIAIRLKCSYWKKTILALIPTLAPVNEIEAGCDLLSISVLTIFGYNIFCGCTCIATVVICFQFQFLLSLVTTYCTAVASKLVL